jgi:tellurite resistance protein
MGTKLASIRFLKKGKNMANVYQIAKDLVNKELRRFRNRHFLEATMAASALLALADQEILMSERLALDFVLENVTELEIFDVHKAVDLFRDYAEAIQKDPVKGRDEVFKAITRSAKDEHEAEIIIRACILIAKADGAISEAERETIGELCQVLTVDACKIID